MSSRPLSSLRFVRLMRSFPRDNKQILVPFSSKAAQYVGDKSRYVQRPDKEVPYKLGKHRSNALELIEKQPIIEVEGEMAICDGGGGALGHPIEYLALERPGEVKSCLYCGLKFKSKGGHH